MAGFKKEKKEEILFLSSRLLIITVTFSKI
jgi:hypothetical protein